MATGTLLSRVTGLLRTGALAAALGVTSLADAYNIANTVPTILLVLVTGGTLSAVLVPLLVESDDLGERRARAESLQALVLAVTAGATLLAIATSPLLARAFALGQDGAGRDAFVQTTTLLIVLFGPQVLAYGVSVHAVAVLNAAGRLALGSFASVATNVVTIAGIAAYVLLRDDSENGGLTALLVLGVSTTAGVVAMAAIQVWGARRVLPGMRVLPRLRRDETTRRVLRLGRWTLLYVVANQVGLGVVLTVAASSPGGASAYQWGFALMQLPYAIIAVSVLSALYPQVSRAAHADPQRYAALVSDGMRLLLVLLVPAAILLAVLAEQLTRILLGHGAVDEAGIRLIATAVRVFALALLPFTAFQVLTRACFAKGDTKAPAVVNVAVNAVNILGALLALRSSGPSSLGVLVSAYTASYVTGCVLLGAHAHRQDPGVLSGTAGLAARLLVPVGAMAFLGLAVRQLLAADQVPGVAWAAMSAVAVTLASGASYAVLVRFCAPGAWAAVTGRVRRGSVAVGAPERRSWS